MKLVLNFFLIAFGIRIILIFISSQVMLIGLDSDAIGFFERVQLFSWDRFNLFVTDSNIFVVWNYCVMSFLGFSMITGQIFCLLAWSISFWFFSRSISFFETKRFVLIIALFLYCFLPSSMLYSIGFLRESYELLFCNMGLYFFLKFQRSTGMFYWFCSLISFVFAVLLHLNFIIYILFILFWPVWGYCIKHTSKRGRILFVMLLMSLFYFILTSQIFIDFLNAHALGAQSTSDARANYFDFNESRSIISGYLKFLYEPIFRSSLNISDYIVVVENFIRLYILVFAIIKLRWLLITNSAFLFFLIGTFAWSLFTYNWGTGIRHHMPEMGMLLILFVSANYKIIYSN